MLLEALIRDSAARNECCRLSALETDAVAGEADRRLGLKVNLVSRSKVAWDASALGHEGSSALR